MIHDVIVGEVHGMNLGTLQAVNGIRRRTEDRPNLGEWTGGVYQRALQVCEEEIGCRKKRKQIAKESVNISAPKDVTVKLPWTNVAGDRYAAYVLSSLLHRNQCLRYSAPQATPCEYSFSHRAMWLSQENSLAIRCRALLPNVARSPESFPSRSMACTNASTSPTGTNRPVS